MVQNFDYLLKNIPNLLNAIAITIVGVVIAHAVIIWAYLAVKIYNEPASWDQKKDAEIETDVDDLLYAPKFFYILDGKKIFHIHKIAERNRILNSSSDTRIKSHNVWNDPEFVSKYSNRFFADGYALVNEAKNMLARLKTQEASSYTNYNSIPFNCYY